MKRTVLIFSYWFPPSNVIGASRPWAMARFFQSKDWRVIVVCARSEAASFDFDADLDGIEVIRLPDSRLTSFLNFKIGRGRLSRYASTLMRLFSYPDAAWATVSHMYNAARDRLKNGDQVDFIISSALPFSLHPAAIRLAREFNLSLVLDNRDIWACSPYRRRLPFTCWAERALEKRVFSRADLIVSVSNSMSENYKRSYPEFTDRFYCIRNGTDKPLSGPSSIAHLKGDRLSIVYTGILYGNKRDLRPVLQALDSLDTACKFNFYGSEADQVAAYAREHPRLGICDCGRVSRDASLSAQRSADLLVLGLGSDPLENTFLPGKFFEYIAAGRPIIALADPESEVAKIINRYGLGIASRSVTEICVFLKTYLAGQWTHPGLDLHELSREFQLSRLHELMLGVLDAKNPP